MTRPQPLFFIGGTSRRRSRTAEKRFCSNVSFHCSAVGSSQGFNPASAPPALLTRTSIPPSASMARPATLLASCCRARSPIATTALPPCPLISSATRCARSALRPCTTTAAPSRARERAIASPIPLLLPVTRALFPPSFNSFVPYAPGGHHGRSDQELADAARRARPEGD